MRTQFNGIIKMRRVSDKTRMLLAYCAVGLILSFAQIAFSAEAICVDNFEDAAKSPSAAIRNALPLIKGKNMTNQSNGTHLKFSSSDRIYVKLYSTNGFFDNQAEFKEGVIKVCDKNGELSLTSVLSTSSETFEFVGNCFRLTGALARAAGERTHFCEGKMPEKVQAAFERASQTSTVASQPNRNSNDSSIRQ